MNDEKEFETDVTSIPFVVHESIMHRAYRVQCGLVVAMAIVCALMAGIAWFAVLGGC